MILHERLTFEWKSKVLSELKKKKKQICNLVKFVLKKYNFLAQTVS